MGLFIVLEGIDGAGKTLQSALLAEWLREERGRGVVETREPTDGTWGRLYRAWARGSFEASPEQVLEFFVKDRREHVDSLILPALEKGEVVICDRYVASTLAYQAASGVDRALLARTFAEQDFPVPDLTLWLRLPVAQAMQRMGDTATERFEKAEFLESVDREYAALDGLTEVDASGDPEDVQRRLREAVAAL